jgi:uncharacterized protein (DUF4415 family)
MIKTQEETPHRNAQQGMKPFLSEEQLTALRKAGFTQEQIDYLPGALDLTSDQIAVADRIGAFGDDEDVLTPEQLAARPDSEIDYTDMPKLDKAWFAEAVPFSQRHNKVSVTLRLDREILDFFRQPGPGYQTRINAVLRAYMKAQGAPPKQPK